MTRRVDTGWQAITMLLMVLALASCTRDTVVIADFEDDLAWTAHPADGVELEISREARPDGQGQALRLDYRFTGGGYAIARLDTELELSGNYAFRFQIRGTGLANHLEFKLVDPSGENVWWKVWRDVAWPADWRTFRIKQRQLEFAWGPQGGGEVAQVGAIELAITAGAGGQGTVWLDDLELVALPPADAPLPAPEAGASSVLAAHEADLVLDADPATVWSPADDDDEPSLWLDFQQLREYGGLVVTWAPDQTVPDYHVEASDDGKTWRLLRTVTGSNGGRDYHFLPESESRWLRVRYRAPKTGPIAISGLDLKPLAWSATRETFITNIAAGLPRGLLPRGFLDEQVYWTVVGVDADSQEGLLSEDGALEAGLGRFSVEPFLFVDGALVTWDDVVREQTLQDFFLPIPSVTWFHDGPGRDDLRLRIRALGWGEAEKSSLLARYQLENLGDRAREVTLFLAVRPFQVNPPSQMLNQRGGTAPIGRIEKIGDQIVIDGRPAVVLSSAPDGFGATSFFGGEIVVDYLRQGVLPAAAEIDDPFDAASAALAYRWTLAPQESRGVDLVLPLHDHVPTLTNPDVIDYAVSEGWRSVIDKVTITGPPAADETLQTLKAQLGYILINRSGAGIQPGTRSYARSWIRDGALTSWALLQMGLTEPAREFLEWYAPHQYANGKVPCVVDRRGADPVPEHDSSGEFIFLVAQYFRYTGDRELLKKMWPRVLGAANYLDGLRQLRRTAEYQDPALDHFYGLLPPSISHEGYSAKPMHSYWDDFFALRGFKDAVALAEVLGHESERQRLAGILAEFETDLGNSVERTMAVHGIDYVAGCADLGDFDATSTTIALSPADARDILPAEALERTFERYYRFFLERAAGEPWEAFTPYEVRNIGAMVRLGWRARANQLRDYFLVYRRPPGWRHWAEVVFQDERAARFIGDMPHTWVGSDFVRSVLDMFVYERGSTTDRTNELVLAAGLPAEWLEEGGVAIGGLPTPYGKLSYTLVRKGDTVVMEIDDGLEIPAAGLVLDPPLAAGVAESAVNGKTMKYVSGENVVIRGLPVRVVWR
jgi:hypothetical protein